MIEDDARRENMLMMRAMLAFLSLLTSLRSTLKPINTDLQPYNNKVVITYKTTRQGDLKVNLYFPPGWTKADRRPAIIFFFGGNCATGSPEQFASTAGYLATRCGIGGVPH
jgi:hypothetical protein